MPNLKPAPGAGVHRLFAVLACCLLTLSPAFAEKKRVGIIYSETAKQNYFDDFVYYQLFMAMQYQCAMAGIPYDLLDENDLTDGGKLEKYDVLIAAHLQNVRAADRPQILAALNQAIEKGVGIITSGWFLALDENGNVFPDFVTVLDSMFGVNAIRFNSGVAADLVPNDLIHPAISTYEAGQVIRSYNQIWAGVWIPGSGANPAASSVLCDLNVGGTLEPAVLGITTNAGTRNVHFSNEQLMQDTNLVWSAVQWAVYGDEQPVALRLGRERSIFFARNDMDQSMFAEEVPLVHGSLLDIITEWKQQHDFVGSYYLNVGNKPNQGEFTDWSVSGPLFQQYMDLGNEIGTHSYTHPVDTKLLNAAELKFEFDDSVKELEENLNIRVPGAAVPGAPENPFVIETLEPWLGYLSGRAATNGTTFGYSSAFGNIRPGFNMFYFCLNTSPDFTLIGFRGLSNEETAQIWQDEYATHHVDAPLPVIHWLWHDYGPTESEPGFQRFPFDTMISTAAAGGSEFVTGADLLDRIEEMRDADLEVLPVDADTVRVKVGGADVSRHALVLPEDQVISRVEKWYAYDGNKLFLPKAGGDFVIHTDGLPAPATRITKMPPRARLESLKGNGIELEFTFIGEGSLSMELNQPNLPLQIEGGDSVTLSGSAVTLTFSTHGSHKVTVKESGSSNQPPVANSMSIITTKGEAVSFVLDASDPDENPLEYTVGTPANGTLAGTPPNLTFTPNPGFFGEDQFTFSVSDGLASSDPATVAITVIDAPITVDGNLADWTGIPPLVTDPADNPDTVDILALHAQLDSGVLYLGIDNEGPIGQLNYGYTWYLDTDMSASTGFQMYSIGADYLIEGSTVYRFAGSTPQTWQWSQVGSALSGIQDTTAELAIATTLLGGATSFDLIFWGNNNAFGSNSVDIVPNAGFVRFNATPGGTGIAIDGDFTDWPQEPGQVVIVDDGDDLSGVNAVDIMQVRMTAQDSNLYIGYLNETSLPALGWTYTLYLDTDQNLSTGFQSGTIGADYMVQDAVVYAYAGTGPDWVWSSVTSLLVALNGAQVEIEVPLASIGSPPAFTFEVVGENAALGQPGGPDYATGVMNLVAVDGVNVQVAAPKSALLSVQAVTDTDSDTLTDGWESAYGLNPLDPADAAGDLDHDGRSNLEEFVSGNLPDDPEDFFKMDWDIGPPYAVSTAGKAGRVYSLQRTTDPTTGAWADLITVGPLESDLPVVFTDPDPPNQTTFYRIRVTLP